MQPEPPAELVEIAARFILGPREPVPPSAKYTLAELQQVYWDQSSGQERKEALWATRAVLAAVTPQIEARVTGEIARLREALTPSGDTKAAYMGEFQFNIEYSDEDGGSYWKPHLVPWTTIKEIMAAIRERALNGDYKTGGNDAE